MLTGLDFPWVPKKFPVPGKKIARLREFREIAQNAYQTLINLARCRMSKQNSVELISSQQCAVNGRQAAGSVFKVTHFLCSTPHVSLCLLK